MGTLPRGGGAGPASVTWWVTQEWGCGLMETTWSVSQPLAGSPSWEGPGLWVPSTPPCLVVLRCDSVAFLLMSAPLSVPPGVAVTVARACHTGSSARGLKVQQEPLP